MNLIFGNWCFSPRLVTSLLAAVLFGLFVHLGFWQLDRAEQKRNLFAEFESRQASEAVDLNREGNAHLVAEDLLWRPVVAKGEFLEHYQILLDNQVDNTKAGYFAYTLFKLSDSDNVVLVNRGWLLADPDRAISPELTVTKGLVSITAVAKDIPQTGLLLKELPPEQMGDGIYRVQRIDLDELAELAQVKLLPYIIRLEPLSEHGYRRQWRLPGSGENVNNGYAFQWFAFATALLIIYLLLNVKRKDEKGQEV